MAATNEEGFNKVSVVSFRDSLQQSPKCSPPDNTGKLDGPQQVLEDGTQEALSKLAQAIQAAQRSAFAHVRAQVHAQLSQLTRENRQLRDQLSRDRATSQDLSRPVSRAQSWMNAEEADGLDMPKPAKPTSPEGECAVLEHIEHIETFTLPSAAQEQAHLRPVSREQTHLRPVSRDAWRSSARYGETVLPDQLRSSADSMGGVDKNFSMQHLDSMWAVSDNRQQKRMASIRVRESIKTGDALAVKTTATAKRRLFPDKTELLARVQMTLVKPEYNVANFYYDSGIAQMVARHPAFESLTLGVIVLNSIWIAVDMDHNTDFLEPPMGFVVVENFFCCFFFLELLIRMLAFESKRDCLRDYWFVFDSVLVSLAILEVWVLAVLDVLFGMTTASVTGSGLLMLRLLRIARLAKTARMARLLRAVPEVMIMFKGIAVASHAVICTIFVLAVILYVFALILRQLTMDSVLGESHFRSVPSSMGTLLIKGTLPDFGPFLNDLSDSHMFLGSVGLGFVLLTALVVLNMLAGVLVNVVLLVAELEKEEADAVFVRDALGAILDLGDEDGDKTISKSEFEKLMVNPEATNLLEQVNVDVMGLVELADFIFMDSKDGLNFDDFFKLLLSLRGSNNATVKDLVEMRKFITQEICLLESYIGSALKPVLAKVSSHSNGDLL